MAKVWKCFKCGSSNLRVKTSAWGYLQQKPEEEPVVELNPDDNTPLHWDDACLMMCNACDAEGPAAQFEKVTFEREMIFVLVIDIEEKGPSFEPEISLHESYEAARAKARNLDRKFFIAELESLPGRLLAVTGEIHGGVLDIEYVPPGVVVSIRDYDIENYHEPELTDDDDGAYKLLEFGEDFPEEA